MGANVVFTLSYHLPPTLAPTPPYPVGKRNCSLHCVSGRVPGLSVAVLALVAEARWEAHKQAALALLWPAGQQNDYL